MMVVGRKPKLSPVDARRVRAWARLGRNITQVAAFFGVSRSTLKDYIGGKHKRKDYRD